MIYASAAAVVIALLALIGFRMWLDAKTDVVVFQKSIDDRMRKWRDLIDDIQRSQGAMMKDTQNLYDRLNKSEQRAETSRENYAAIERELVRCQQNIRDLATMPIPQPVDLSKHDAAVVNLGKQLQEHAAHVEAEFKKVRAAQAGMVAQGRGRFA